MRPDIGNLAIVVGGWVLLIALVVVAVILIRKLIRYSRRRENDRQEMLDLMRKQERDNRPTRP